MKKSVLALTATLFLFILLISPSGVHAGEVTERVRSTIDEALAVLKDPSLQGESKTGERRSRIREAVVKLIDFNEMTRRSLGVHWKKRTDAEKSEFVDLFSDLLENSYISKIEQQTDEKVLYLAEKKNKKGTKALVKTKVITSKDTEVPISYRMTNKTGNWMAYDIVIEGVSLVSNYRSQFGKIITSSSYEDLVATLKKKVEKIKSAQ
ncbi:MAG: phospholipid-binding protein MlaC [Thermodesulfobacteriota bacterium]